MANGMAAKMPGMAAPLKAPDGHFKFPHLWPVKFLQAGRPDYASGLGFEAMRAAASLSR
jgi:hypothetical protein